MVNKTGDAHTDYLIDKNIAEIQRLEAIAESKAEENGKLIEKIYANHRVLQKLKGTQTIA